MSKPAEGQNGAQMGTAAYVQHLNQASGITAYLPDLGGCDYRGALHALASRARGTIDGIYGDLQTHLGVLRYISKGKRENLSSLVQRLEDICTLAGADAGKARECRAMLSLSGFAGMSSSMSTDSDLEKGVSLIRGGGQSGLDNFLRASTVKEAAQWGESFAAGSDLTKKAFLNELAQRQSTGYLKDVWDLYSYQQNPDGYCGANGCTFCSDSYVSAMEQRIFSGGTSLFFAQTDYAALIRKGLQSILMQIEADVAAAQRGNDYLETSAATRVLDIVTNLESCGISGSFSLRIQIQKLCWYTPLDSGRIRSLQRSLNQLGMGVSLKEDGVYGEKTSASYHEFLSNLAHGTFPSLIFITPLQTEFTGVSHSLRNGQYSRLLLDGFETPVFRADRHFYNGTQNFLHINVAVPDDAPRVAQQAAKALDHMEVSPEVYNLLKNMENSAKYVKIAGRVLLVAGAALDAFEVVSAMHSDLTDADQKLGKTTATAVASVGGRWAGGIGGAKLGAIAGATVGTAILPGIGTAVGGFAGGVVMGIAGSFAGSQFGQWIVDITDVEEWFR